MPARRSAVQVTACEAMVTVESASNSSLLIPTVDVKFVMTVLKRGDWRKERG
jgi:hypothetical protein